jgi:hypothetical protein
VDVDTGANSTAGFTARCNDTTVATTSGTARTLEELAWNERNTPCEFRWLDEREMPVCANAAALVVRNQTTVGDDLGGTTYMQAVGGTLASSGALAKRTNRALGGTLTSAGAPAKQTVASSLGRSPRPVCWPNSPGGHSGAPWPRPAPS